MISQSIVTLSVLAAVLATPIPDKRNFGFGGFGEGFGFGSFHGSDVNVHESSTSISLDSFHGFHSLDHFDDFFGVNNFCGFANEFSSSLVVAHEEEVVCRSVSVEIIQQQLTVIREYVRRLITTQICEIETQTIVFSQFQAGLFGFGEDIRHTSGRSLGFDSAIASQIVNLHDESGAIVTRDLGFSGSDIGKSFVVPSGLNWNPSTSPASVSAAYSAAQAAASASGGQNALPPPTSSSSAPPADVSGSEVAPPPASNTEAESATDAVASATESDAIADSTASVSSAASAQTSAANPDSSSAHPNPADD